jgi:hypothetical protein
MLLALLLGLACEPDVNVSECTDCPVRASWQRLDPPRRGLRCWYTYSVGHGGVYCEPDPSATHGAFQ